MAYFCVHFSKNFKHLDEVQEVVITYRRGKNILAELCKKENLIITINISQESEKQERDLKLWQNLYKKYGNLKVRVPFKERAIWQKLGQCGVPYFFSDPVGDLSVIQGICKLPHPPHEIFVSGFLTYDLKKVADYLHSHNIKVRVIPNIAQSEWFSNSLLKSFFILPEAIDYYSNFVDIFELFSDNIIQNNNAVYEIYSSGKFVGPLKALIAGLQVNGDNTPNLSALLSIKASCQYRCVLDGYCHICDNIYGLLKSH